METVSRTVKLSEWPVVRSSPLLGTSVELAELINNKSAPYIMGYQSRLRGRAGDSIPIEDPQTEQGY